jgi:hypothetical protein
MTPPTQAIHTQSRGLCRESSQFKVIVSYCTGSKVTVVYRTGSIVLVTVRMTLDLGLPVNISGLPVTSLEATEADEEGLTLMRAGEGAVKALPVMV